MASPRYSPEVRARAVRPVLDHEEEFLCGGRRSSGSLRRLAARWRRCAGQYQRAPVRWHAPSLFRMTPWRRKNRQMMLGSDR